MKNSQTATESELDILRIIWQSGGRTRLAPLLETLAEKGRNWKPNTVLTFLSRLCDKGMLAVEKQGRINEYVALLSEKEYTESLTRSFLGEVYGGDAKGLVAALLRQDQLTKKDMEELQDFWNRGKDHA